MTIDVAKLRRRIYLNWRAVSLTKADILELLDAYEERDRLRAAATEATRLQAEVERYKGLWLRGSERHAHAIRAQHEHNQTIIRELTGGQAGTNDD